MKLNSEEKRSFTDPIFRTIEEKDAQLIEQPDNAHIPSVSISQYKSDMGFLTLMQMFDRWIYVLPRYQRKFVWTFRQVEALAVSLIKNMPIPPIYVYKNEFGQMEILDGQQRLFSLFLYYKGVYFKSEKERVSLQKIFERGMISENKKLFYESLSQAYTLKRVEYKVDRQTDDLQSGTTINYANLSGDVRNALDFRTISVIEIKVEDIKDRNRILYKIFENLNAGGIPLANQEIRNGVFQSKFYDMLHNVNASDELWRKIFGCEEHMHSKDVELLLRFCASTFYFEMDDKGVADCSKYAGSYPKLLNDFSAEAMKFSQEKIDEYERDIHHFMQLFSVTNMTLPSVLLESLYFVTNKTKIKCKITNAIIMEIFEGTSYKEHAKTSSAKSYMEKRYEDVYSILSKYAQHIN